MKKLIILPLALCFLLPACGTKDVNTQPKLTPEETFALAKGGAVTAANALGLLIGELEKKPGVSTEKLRILKICHVLITEFNQAVRDVPVINLANREAIGRAIDTVLISTDNLLRNDVLPIADVELKAQISRAIQLIRGAVEAVRLLMPARAK